jgi:subtilisin
MAILAAAVFALAAALAGFGGATAHQAKAAPPSSSSYIVVLNDGVNADAVTTSLERNLGFKSQFRYGTALKGFAAHLNAQQLQKLQADPQVQFVSPDGTVQAVGLVPIAPGDTAPTGVRRINAATPTMVKKTKVGAKVAVIDTGIDLNHTDLNSRSGKDCVQPGTPAQDDNGHGTHVAGTVAAKNNGTDVVGVTPGTRVFAVKVLDASGSGSFAQVICGIDWVAANGPGTRKNIRVANMSLAGGGSDDGNCGHSNFDAMHTAICNAVTTKGVTFVVAAANSGVDFASAFPAAYNEVLTASAIAVSDGLSGGTGGPPSCRPSETDDRYA